MVKETYTREVAKADMKDGKTEWYIELPAQEEVGETELPRKGIT